MVWVQIVCFYSISISQNQYTQHYDYSYADSIALNLPHSSYHNISELARALTKDIPDQNEQFRAIFRWITDNIEYSHSNPTADPNQVLIRRKAVCSGYASLLKALCDNAGIECDIVHGYAKSSVNEIGVKFAKTNHAWNAVKINNNSYLIDVTWASGYYSTQFTKDFDESYFFADPNFLILSHFPIDKRWQFLECPCLEKTFNDFPIVYQGFEKSHIKMNEKISGKINDKISLKLYSSENLRISYAYAGSATAKELICKKKGNCYEIDCDLKPSYKGELTVYVNGVSYLGFKKE